MVCKKQIEMEFDLEYGDLSVEVVADVERWCDEGTYDTPPHYEYEVRRLDIQVTDEHGKEVKPLTLQQEIEIFSMCHKYIEARVWD